MKILTTGHLQSSSDQAKASTLPAALSQGPSKLLHYLSRANGKQVDQAPNVPQEMQNRGQREFSTRVNFIGSRSATRNDFLIANAVQVTLLEILFKSLQLQSTSST